MKIGELARRSGVSERMLRYYEAQGLLRPSRAANGYRDYGEAEMGTARRIRILSEAGLKVEAIRVLLPCMADGTAGRFEPCAEVRAALAAELARLENKLRDLAESRDTVARYLAGLA